MRLWIIFKFSYLGVYGHCFSRGRGGCWHFSIRWGRSPGFPLGLHWGLLDMGRSSGSSQATLDFGGKECVLTALHKWYLEAVVSLLLRWWYKSWTSTRLPQSSSRKRREGWGVLWHCQIEVEAQVSDDMRGGMAGMKVLVSCSALSDANLAGVGILVRAVSPGWKCQLPPQPLEARVAVKAYMCISLSCLPAVK